jgi:hypothetical protein
MINLFDQFVKRESILKEHGFKEDCPNYGYHVFVKNPFRVNIYFDGTILAYRTDKDYKCIFDEKKGKFVTKINRER